MINIGASPYLGGPFVQLAQVGPEAVFQTASAYADGSGGEPQKNPNKYLYFAVAFLVIALFATAFVNLKAA
jgi:hypothetical protein